MFDRPCAVKALAFGDGDSAVPTVPYCDSGV